MSAARSMRFGSAGQGLTGSLITGRRMAGSLMTGAVGMGMMRAAPGNHMKCETQERQNSNQMRTHVSKASLLENLLMAPRTVKSVDRCSSGVVNVVSRRS